MNSTGTNKNQYAFDLVSEINVDGQSVKEIEVVEGQIEQIKPKKSSEVSVMNELQKEELR